MLTNLAQDHKPDLLSAEAAEKTDSQPVYFKQAVSSVQGFTNFVKYKFSPDQWYGTLINGIGLYKSVLQLKASWHRNVVAEGGNQDSLRDNKVETNIPLSIANSGAVAISLWALLSSRGAIPPAGNSYKERIVDALKHPERSHEQAKFIAQTATNIICFWMAIQHGFTSKGQKEERWPRRYQAVTMPILVGLSVVDLFGPRQQRELNKAPNEKLRQQENPVMFQKSQSKTIAHKLAYPFRIIAAGWRENPRRMISLGLGISHSIAMMTEGFLKHRSMLNRLQLASMEDSLEWRKMRDQLLAENEGWKELAECGALPAGRITTEIKKMREEKLVESNSILKSSSIGLLTTFAGAFYTLDQLHKGEVALKQQQARMERDNGKGDKSAVAVR